MSVKNRILLKLTNKSQPQLKINQKINSRSQFRVILENFVLDLVFFENESAEDRGRNESQTLIQMRNDLTNKITNMRNSNLRPDFQLFDQVAPLVCKNQKLLSYSFHCF